MTTSKRRSILPALIFTRFYNHIPRETGSVCSKVYVNGTTKPEWRVLSVICQGSFARVYLDQTWATIQIKINRKPVTTEVLGPELK